MFFREIDRTLFPARPLIHVCVCGAAAPNSFFNKDQRTYPTMFFGGGDPFEHFAGMHGGPGGPGGMRGGPRKDVDTTALYDTLGVSLSFRSAWSGGHGPQTWHCTVGISTGSREQKFDRDRRRISGPIRENGNGTEGRGQASADLLAVVPSFSLPARWSNVLSRGGPRYAEKNHSRSLSHRRTEFLTAPPFLSHPTNRSPKTPTTRRSRRRTASWP